MAVIRIKKSLTTGTVPTLVDGELAINIADMKLFARDSTGTIKFTNFTSDAEKVASGPIKQALDAKVTGTVQGFETALNTWFSALPTASTGLTSGQWWNNAGVPTKVV